MSQKFWLFLEPYVFIFKGKPQNIVYNTINGHYIKCTEDDHLNKIINGLLASNSGYCLLLDENDLANQTVCDFIFQIRNSFSGDLVNTTDVKYRPFIFRPKLKMMNDSEIKDNDDTSVNGRNILKNLHEVTVYLNASCKQSCRFCQTYYKQFNCCTKFNNQTDIPLNKFVELLKRLDTAGVGKVNFILTDISQYKDWTEIINLFPIFHFSKNLYIHCNNLSDININLLLKCTNLAQLKILIPVDAFSVFFKNSYLNLDNHNIEYQFIIDSNSNIETLENDPLFQSLNRIEWRPVYTGNNDLFFSQNIFIEFDDILNSPINKTTIFRRQVLNEHFYGRVTIFPNGDAFANVNKRKIGNVFIHSLNEIIYKEMSIEKSWFYTRDKSECRTCCNRYLCPSPSNYEFVIKKNNLCNIH
ncbi:MAG: TIGR04150 pseudo-rSAM protein [Tannerellaceae bacterium]|jgi:pseudo-rSAM protein|nr:TIGR04150 pseudo-rSAM protein [Tannerellaceae bacterium]